MIINKLEKYIKYRSRANEIKELLDTIRTSINNNDINTINKLDELVGGDINKDSLNKIEEIKELLDTFEEKTKQLNYIKENKFEKKLKLLDLAVQLKLKISDIHD